MGGGVAGLTLAYELVRRGASVVLVDAGASTGASAGEPAVRAAASLVPAALLNPHRGRTARARPGDMAGLEAFWRLARRLEEEGLDPGARGGGVLRVAGSARQAKLWRRLADGRSARGAEAGEGRGAEPLHDEGADDLPLWLGLDEVPRGLHAPYGALFVPRGGWVEPARLLAALAAAAARRGAAFVRGVPARGVEARADGAAVLTTAGEVLARRVVLCPGAAPAPPGCRLPSLRRDGGVAAVLRPAAGDARALAALPPLAGAVNVAFVGGRVVVSGGALPPVRPTDEELHAAALGLRDAAAWSVPALAHAELADVWFGVRARRPSGRPVVRRLSPVVTLYGALAGRGFLCAADLSARLAERLLGD